MGCASGQKQQSQALRLPTKNGVLRVTIVSGKIEHETSSFFSMDPFIKIRMSNQSATSKIVSKGGKQPVFNESFQFFINSCFKPNGRHLQIELWDKNKTSDSLIGFGMTDIDPILASKQPKKDVRIFLNYDLKPAGIINVVLQFKEEPIDLLSFRFETASIRRKTSTLSSMNCFVQVTLGEQVLKTKKKKDTDEMPPVWVDEYFIFNAPKIVKNCLIQVFDDDQLVGQLTMKLQDLLKQSKQKQYDEQIHYKDVIAGTLRFQTLLGVNPQFSQVKRDYKRKPPQQQKKQDKKQDKKDDKDKKQQDPKAKKQQKDAKNAKPQQKPSKQTTDKPKQQPKKQ